MKKRAYQRFANSTFLITVSTVCWIFVMLIAIAGCDLSAFGILLLRVKIVAGTLFCAAAFVLAWRDFLGFGDVQRFATLLMFAFSLWCFKMSMDAAWVPTYLTTQSITLFVALPVISLLLSPIWVCRKLSLFTGVALIYRAHQTSGRTLSPDRHQMASLIGFAGFIMVIAACLPLVRRWRNERDSNNTSEGICR